MLFHRKNAEIQGINCDIAPDGKRLICSVIVVANNGKVFEDKVYSDIPKVSLKETKKGVKIDYED